MNLAEDAEQPEFITPLTEHGSTATCTTVIADGRSLQVGSLTEVPYEYIRSEQAPR